MTSPVVCHFTNTSTQIPLPAISKPTLSEKNQKLLHQ